MALEPTQKQSFKYTNETHFNWLQSNLLYLYDKLNTVNFTGSEIEIKIKYTSLTLRILYMYFPLLPKNHILYK